MDIPMPLPTLTILNDVFAIHRFSASAPIPEAAMDSPFMVISRIDKELSLVVPESIELESDQSEGSWACIRVNGPLDLAQVGIMAGISTTLANAEVSLFAISTYDTDYILVKVDHFDQAKSALEAEGYKFLKAHRQATEDLAPWQVP
jgi:hypothetical protein